MATKSERQIIRKALAYDILTALEENPEKQTFTVAELNELITTLVDEENQK